MNDLITFTAQQVALIRRTVAKDANPLEFDLFVEMCRARGLNPLMRHAYCFVFHKTDETKRQMVVVVSRDGQRAVAERTGNYRPDEKAPRFDIGDKDEHSNPAGLISAEVSVYKFSHGTWFPVTEVAYWEEYAPIVDGGEGGFEWVETGEVWEDSGKPKKKKVPLGKAIKTLDPAKDNWRRMPRIMLAKCAEMAALRKAFPDQFGGLYGEGEIDRGEVLDLTPSELAEKADQEKRLARVGGPDTYITDWIDGNALEAVPGGRYYDQVMAFIKSCAGEPSAIRAWRERNQHTFNQFWAVHKGEALALKAEIERSLSQAGDEAA